MYSSRSWKGKRWSLLKIENWRSLGRGPKQMVSLWLAGGLSRILQCHAESPLDDMDLLSLFILVLHRSWCSRCKIYPIVRGLHSTMCGWKLCKFPQQTTPSGINIHLWVFYTLTYILASSLPVVYATLIFHWECHIHWYKPILEYSPYANWMWRNIHQRFL